MGVLGAVGRKLGCQRRGKPWDKGDECIPPPLPPASPKASVLLQRIHLHFSVLFLKLSPKQPVFLNERSFSGGAGSFPSVQLEMKKPDSCHY